MVEVSSSAAFYRAQAERARRLAEQIRFTNPDIAAALEALAQEFDERARRAADDADPPTSN